MLSGGWACVGGLGQARACVGGWLALGWACDGVGARRLGGVGTGCTRVGTLQKPERDSRVLNEKRTRARAYEGCTKLLQN